MIGLWAGGACAAPDVDAGGSAGATAGDAPAPRPSGGTRLRAAAPYDQDERVTEDALLAAARGGDADAFARLVAGYRGELQAHCYRMLGGVHDAEDALQDTLLRAWRGLPRFEGRSSLRGWLYTIATNVCRRALDRRSRRMLPMDLTGPGDPADPLAEPPTEIGWLEPFPDTALPASSPAARYEQRESVELAFVAALHHLPPRQRAVLILRDVLGFSGEEVAGMLETTAASVASALQRARRTVDAGLPERSQQATLRSLGDAAARAAVTDFVDAWSRNDVDAVVALLTDDVTLAMPPTATWFRGREAVAAFLRTRPLMGGNRWLHVPVGANGQLAVAHYVWNADRGLFVGDNIDVLTLRGPLIAAFTAFRTPALLPAFGLAEVVPG